MKPFTICAIMCLLAYWAMGQEAADSLASQALREVVIEAPQVVRKADMDVYYPSQSSVAGSKNGLQLINNMMIPSLTVTEALGTIQAAGEEVQVRINGRVASIDQVRSLQPGSVKRVEWITSPGLRYKGARYVLNFIVANPTLGGSLQAEAEPVLNTGWGFAWADLKLNNGRSQWDVGANFKYSNKLKSHRDYTQTFTFTDGNTIGQADTCNSGPSGCVAPATRCTIQTGAATPTSASPTGVPHYCASTFGRYDQGFKMVSKWTTSEQHTRLDMRMPYVKVAYNVQWGHQKRATNKLINAGANVDTSKAGGR